MSVTIGCISGSRSLRLQNWSRGWRCVNPTKRVAILNHDLEVRKTYANLLPSRHLKVFSVGPNTSCYGYPCRVCELHQLVCDVKAFHSVRRKRLYCFGLPRSRDLVGTTHGRDALARDFGLTGSPVEQTKIESISCHD